MSKEAKLVIDFGNSQTRFAVMFKGKENQTAYFHVSNSFVELPEGYTVPEAYRDDPETQFIQLGGSTYAHGSIVESEFSKSSLRPSTLTKKFNSITTDLALELALVLGIRRIAEYAGQTSNEEGLADELEWKIFALLPPNDIAIGRDKMRERYKNMQSVSYIKPDADGSFENSAPTVFKTDITAVNVIPEGYAAFFGAMFKTPGVFNDGVDKDTVESLTLIVDIGSGTTDCCIVNNAQLVSSSQDTINIGGRHVVNEVSRMLRADNIELADSVVEGIVNTGVYTISPKRSIDYTDMVNAARAEVARKINAGITRYLESSDFSPTQIAGILPVGGGSVRLEGSGLRPLSEFVCDEIQRNATFSDVVPTPVGISPRDLNVIGAAEIAGAR